MKYLVVVSFLPGRKNIMTDSELAKKSISVKLIITMLLLLLLGDILLFFCRCSGFGRLAFFAVVVVVAHN